jgi:hypothetical protein
MVAMNKREARNSINNPSHGPDYPLGQATGKPRSERVMPIIPYNAMWACLEFTRTPRAVYPGRGEWSEDTASHGN